MITIARKRIDEKLLTPKNLECIRYMCESGATEEKVAEFLTITRQTLHNLKRRNPKLVEILNSSKNVADVQVENAMYKRCLGYEEIETSINAKGDTSTYIKQIPPDVKACIFWLKNRQPDRWKDKQELEAKIESNNKVDLSGLTLEQLQKLADGDE